MMKPGESVPPSTVGDAHAEVFGVRTVFQRIGPSHGPSDDRMAVPNKPPR